MCGIVGYIGDKPALPVLLEGLKKLEYRGYDSAGVAVLNGQGSRVYKREGRMIKLEEGVSTGDFDGTAGLGHTRWATHGRPSDFNAHPHDDCTGTFVVVHNGIIENYRSLREWLQGKGHTFKSETDTEVIPHLVEELYRGDLEEAVRQAVGYVRGSYALAVMSYREPDKLVAVRQDSPLIVGLGKGENFLASDIPALLAHTRDAYILDDGEMAVLTREGVRLTTTAGRPVEKEVFHVKWDPLMAERGGYPHFMLKEIHEQPKAIRDTLTGRLAEDDSRVILEEVRLSREQVASLGKIYAIACGTAYHAGLVGKYLIEKLARLPVEVDLASEFRYRDPLIGPDSLMLVISQSGETADTLAALREGRRRGARVLAITNVVGSAVAREADDVIFTWAGPEIAVASTKAYTTQLVSLALVAVYLAEVRGTMDEAARREFLGELRRLPQKASEVLAREEEVKRLARKCAGWEDVFFIGRGVDYAVALEGQLKLKEISYIHAEAYAAGELKHGTLALIEEGIPVIALVTQEALYEKMRSNITEVKARDAHVTALALEGDDEIQKYADDVLHIPRTHPLLTPPLAVIPLQLLAYHAAVARGTDVDKPRNLAKSVTVE